MYTKDSIFRRIEKEGIESVIKDLTSSNFSEEAKASLTSERILVDGFINLSLLYCISNRQINMA